jgi:hypothetical protein
MVRTWIGTATVSAASHIEDAEPTLRLTAQRGSPRQDNRANESLRIFAACPTVAGKSWERGPSAPTNACSMTIVPPIDPRQLAAEIEAATSEFNRLANLAGELGLQVEAVLIEQQMVGWSASRPILQVRVIQPG